MKLAQLHNLIAKFYFENKALIITNILSFLILILHFLFHNKTVLNMEGSLFYADEEKSFFTLMLIIISSITGFLFMHISPKSINVFNKKKLINITTGLFFFMLVIDEYLGLHEYLSTLINKKIIYEIPWIFIFFPLLSLIILNFYILIREERQKEIRKYYSLGTITFIFVLLLELIGGYILYDRYNYMFIIIVGIEEFCEILGVSLFLQGILKTK